MIKAVRNTDWIFYMAINTESLYKRPLDSSPSKLYSFLKEYKEVKANVSSENKNSHAKQTG